jgi:hypothetical protein
MTLKSLSSTKSQVQRKALRFTGTACSRKVLHTRMVFRASLNVLLQPANLPLIKSLLISTAQGGAMLTTSLISRRLLWWMIIHDPTHVDYKEDLRPIIVNDYYLSLSITQAIQNQTFCTPVLMMPSAYAHVFASFLRTSFTPFSITYLLYSAVIIIFTASTQVFFSSLTW